MSVDKAKPKKLTDLRKVAEDTLQVQTYAFQEQRDKDTQSLIHELRAHQIELEMQNEDLRTAQEKLEEARNKYADLYDFAPVGYFTFDRNGLILKVNLTGARRLGMKRNFLIGVPFYLYVSPESRSVFSWHLKQVFDTKIRQICEIKLKDKEGTQFDARLESLTVQNEEDKFNQCRTVVSDISEYKRAEKALRECEHQYCMLSELSPVGIFHTDAEGDYVYTNERWQTMAGLASGEALGQGWVKGIHPDDKERISAEWYQTVREHKQFKSEYRFQRSDGLIIWVLGQAIPEQDNSGEVIRYIGAITDITERKLAEEALQIEIAENKKAKDYIEFLANIGSQVNDAVVATDGSLCITYWNKGAEQLYGFKSDEALGQPLKEVIRHHWLKQEDEQAANDSLTATGSWHGETVNIKKSGEEMYVDLSIHMLRNADGTAIGSLSIVHDITEHKRTEELIREQAELLDKARDAIGVRDLEHRIIYWNKGAQRLYGWMKEEVMGKNADELLYKDGGNSPKLIEAKKSVIEKGEWVGELYQITKSGEEIIVDGHWTLIYDSEGKPKSILIINTDITQKKRLEAQLLRAQRMESIGTLAGGIAHDLNNMLTPIMLSLQVLKEKFKDEQSQALLNILENNTQRGANLVKQVLSFSRGIEGERRVLQIEDIVSEVDKIIEETIPKYIEIQINTPRDLWTVSGNAIQLHQVLMNLCVNARDAMPYGGVLKITASNFLIDENYARMNTEAKVGPYVIISVSDTGTGIPPEIMDKIFEPFFTTKERGKGTGLGLSIALGIVKSHGGFITVDSKVGKGTTFMVYLPAIKAERQEVEMRQHKLPAGHGELVLVVEDEDSIRKITCSALEANGYQVLTANNGAEAVILYAQNRDKIKVVLMDLMMPVMDGKESIRVIRRISHEVKIITVSGLAEKEELEKVTENSVQAFLPKPYTAEKLLRTIRDVLSKWE